MSRFEPDNAANDRDRNQALSDLLGKSGLWNKHSNARIVRVDGGWSAESPDEVTQPIDGGDDGPPNGAG